MFAVSKYALFERTVRRNFPLIEKCYVVQIGHILETAKHQLEAQCPQKLRTEYILEPEGKNTAPAIAFAALEMPPNEDMLSCLQII